MNIGKICPDIIKREIKRQNWMNEMRAPSRCYDEATERSRKTWEQYELVNRDFCPDDPVYSNVKAGTALSTSADALFFKAASAGQARILELIIGGEATSSAVCRVGVAQVNATLASNANVTPEKFNSRSPAAAGTYGNANTSALLAGNMLVLAAAVLDAVPARSGVQRFWGFSPMGRSTGRGDVLREWRSYFCSFAQRNKHRQQHWNF